MAVIQRPAKEGAATTYQGKVAQGFTKILAAEVDADLDTIYAAWNGGADSVNIGSGSITSDKLAPGAVGTRELADGGVKTIDLGDLQVTTIKLADLCVTTEKLGPGAVTSGQIADGTIGPQDLSGGCVTKDKLAPGAAVRGSTGATIPSGVVVGPQSGTAIAITPTMTTSGGLVILTSMIGWWLELGIGNCDFRYILQRDGANLASARFNLGVNAAIQSALPSPMLIDAAPPGTHSWSIAISITGVDANKMALHIDAGVFYAYELA
jgi:hypothetical protein